MSNVFFLFIIVYKPSRYSGLFLYILPHSDAICEELWNYDFYKFKEFVEYLSKSDVEVITTKDAFADYR